MEKAISDGGMPVAKYYLVHWGSSITDAKKAKLLQWIHDHRVANYSNPATAPRFAGEPVQPLPDSLPTDARKAALGEMLYNDPRLSSDNTVSCASCHGLHTGGVDNRRYSEGVNGSLGGVNAPTVFNAALNFEQFWDGRAHTLADQAGGPRSIRSKWPAPPGNRSSESSKPIPEFTAMFLKVYPGLQLAKRSPGRSASTENAHHTGQPFRSLPKGRFGGDCRAGAARIRTVQRERRCATCHVGPLLGGQSFEYMGLAQDYFAARGRR
ncbi:MAG: cytochrome c peroxidase [Alistipes indistinctus]